MEFVKARRGIDSDSEGEGDDCGLSLSAETIAALKAFAADSGIAVLGNTSYHTVILGFVTTDSCLLSSDSAL